MDASSSSADSDGPIDIKASAIRNASIKLIDSSIVMLLPVPKRPQLSSSAAEQSLKDIMNRHDIPRNNTGGIVYAYSMYRYRAQDNSRREQYMLRGHAPELRNLDDMVVGLSDDHRKLTISYCRVVGYIRDEFVGEVKFPAPLDLTGANWDVDDGSLVIAVRAAARSSPGNGASAEHSKVRANRMPRLTGRIWGKLCR